ncbi:MAG: hypothetical protein GXO65_01195 [Euryarchaeota archaeon]|nr:hypothetical protein [Euryarchaeota archaeon]
MRKLSAGRLLRPDAAVAGAYVIFLALAWASYRLDITSRYLFASAVFPGPPSWSAYGLTALGLAALVLFVRKGRGIRVRAHRGAWSLLALALLFPVTALTIYLTLDIPLPLVLAAAMGYILILRTIACRFRDVRGVVLAAGSLAVASSILVPVLSGGVPILDPEARLVAAMSPFRALFHGFAVFAATLAVVYYGRRYLLLAAALGVLGVISGFKSDAIAVLLSASIGGLISGRLRAREVALAGIPILGILTLMSTHIAVLAFGSWNIPPLYYPFYRAGFTFLVFDRIVEMALPWGMLGGGAILSTSQKVVSTAVLGYAEPHIITSTLLGPLTLDFGIPGTLITSAFVGLYLGMVGNHRGPFQTALYAIVLTHTLILIEVGLQLTSLILYISVFYLYLAWKGDG